MAHSNQGFESMRYRRTILSRHAEKRARQRAIDLTALPLLMAYGSLEHDGNGCIRYAMTPRAHAKLCRAVGRTRQVEALAGTYAVVSVMDQTVVTIGHLHS